VAPVSKWSLSDLPDLSGRTVLVTGANGGIGFEAASVFASLGAHVVLGCRDAQRGEQALARIAAQAIGTGRSKVESLRLDLASLASIRQAARSFSERHERLDILCNNAGVMAIPRTLTEDGFETQLGVNHFGHFALTGLLLGALRQSPAGRVVTVSSTAHRMGRMRFEDLDGERSYHKWSAYAQSKLANLLFTYELQRRLERADAPVISVACHPGYANTNLQLVGPARERSRAGLTFFRFCNAVFAQSAVKGAWPTLYAAASPELRGAEYIGPGGPAEIAGRPVKVDSSRASHDLQAAARLWEISVARTGVDYSGL
jgi:NAD(P)-dependent dehydrogenase (short-subunit alcohol dehydrogenase family)